MLRGVTESAPCMVSVLGEEVGEVMTRTKGHGEEQSIQAGSLTRKR